MPENLMSVRPKEVPSWLALALMETMELDVKLQQLTPTTSDQTLRYSCTSHLHLDSQQPDGTVVRREVVHLTDETDLMPRGGTC